MKATVSSKGQVTIPKALRDRFGLRAGSIVDFREEGGRLVVVKAEAEDPVTAVFGALSDLDMHTDAVIAALRGAE